MGKLLKIAAAVAGLAGNGFIVHAAPTCSLIASNFQASFDSTSCDGDLSEGCVASVGTGEVVGFEVDALPWNTDVAIIPSDNAEEDLTSYNSGTVLLYSTWDWNPVEWCWEKRLPVSGTLPITTDINAHTFDGKSYLLLNLDVAYTPPPSLITPGDYSYGLEYSSDFDWDFPAGDFAMGFPGACGHNSLNFPGGQMSMSYDMSYNFMKHSMSDDKSVMDDDLMAEDFFLHDGSYSMSYEYSYYMHMEDVVSFTNFNAYVCSNDEVGGPFECDPSQNGSDECWEAAQGTNAQVLRSTGFDMFCSYNCLLQGSGTGFWCNIFGIRGCQMCLSDCSLICGPGISTCDTCVACSSDGSSPPAATPSVTPTVAPVAAPTNSSIPPLSLSGCTPGDAQTCYSQINNLEAEALEISGKGLTCEASCIAEDGYWCNAFNLEGCRFCAHDCSSSCELEQIDSSDCICFPCPSSP